MTLWVVDASVAVKWVTDEEHSARAATLLLDADLHAPAHWLAEAVNVLWAKVSRGQMLEEGARTRAAALRRAPVRPAPLSDLAEPALLLSLQFGVTLYDTLYMALAQSLSVNFVTADQRLMRKVPASYGHLVWVGDLSTDS